MTHTERRDLAHLYGQTPHGVLFVLVDVRGHASLSPGARSYVTSDAERAGSSFVADFESEVLRNGLVETRMHVLADADVLVERGSTAEADALMEAWMASLEGELRVVATVLPGDDAALLRFVMDEHGDVLFASDSLETEDIVPLRRFARTSAHGVTHVSSHGRLFVERMEPVAPEERILYNDISHTEAE
ncbi:MAG: hypothetical protein V4734_11960 [Terriglobus sp.]